MESDRRNPEPLPSDADQSGDEQGNHWLRKARDAYTTSTDYCKSNVWRQWRKNLCHFRNQHDHATKYAQKGYAGRSRVFRPKTRSSLRNSEAALARALFSNNDLVNIKAGDAGSPEQRASADVVKEILNYRLTKKLYWYLTAMGAYQDTYNYGICISKQSWLFDSHVDRHETPLMNEGMTVLGEDGMPEMAVQEDEVVDKDDLNIDLIPPENFRFSPMADWRDPVATSPYLIELIPMYAGEVLEKMQQVDDKTGQPQWKKYSLEDVLSANKDEFNEVRRAREGDNRSDPADEFEGTEFSTVWVHQNIMREGGQDWFYLTLGTHLMLTDPRPVEEVFAQGRPYVVGISIIEAHKTHPAGGTELGCPLQQEINEIANQRLDNVRLVLNKRYYIKRNGNVDLDALKRNIPGSGVLMNDVDAVKTVDTNDVTSSSYAEQDRLAVELDELLGNFSQASVQSNRNLNETVGGMNMMGDSANSVQEYTIRTFIESWVEPVLRQCIKLIQLYETDTTIVSLCAKQANVYQKYRVEQITDQMIARDLTTTVNVGMGNTDPTKRVNRLMLGINTAVNLPGAAQRLDSDEVINELFANLGYQDGERFFTPAEDMEEQEPPPDPKMMEVQARMQIAQQEAQIRQHQIQMDMEIAQARLQNDREIAMMKLALEKDLKLSEIQSRLGLQQQQVQQKDKQIQTTRDIAALKEKNKLIDIDWKNNFAELKYAGKQPDTSEIPAQ
ncbi:MAG: hypothetical protein LPD71_00090 [Shewanella sp.]|nr:hypothetical protein [Shewanella sp.]MCF1437201.1 hypothetical protein [Shewanella sp.]